MLQKLCNRVLLALFGAVILLTPILTFALPEKTVSYYENRALAEWPTPDAQSVASGQYFADWDAYVSDHIVGRNTILKTYASIQRALPKVEVNNVVETDSGALLPLAAHEAYDPKLQARIMDKKTSELKALAGFIEENGGLFCYVGLPEQRYIYYDEYPDYLAPGRTLVDYCEERVFDALAQTNAVAVNMREVFEQTENPKDYYLSVDTHYNYDGALLTYRTLLAAINERLDTPLKIYTDEELNFYTETRELYGAYSRRIANLQTRKEYLTWAEPKQAVPFTRQDNGYPTESVTYRQPDDEICAYAGYMGGDIGETIIDTGRDNLPRVLMFGDSFTNPLEGLVYASCGEFRSLDLRHYTEKTLYEYIEDYQPDIVIAVRDNLSYNQDEGNGTYR